MALDADVPLAVALGVDPDAVTAPGPFAIVVEPLSPAEEPKPRGSYRRRADVDACLGPYEPDARGGVRDAAIAKRTGLSRRRVQHWRNRLGIRGKRGRQSAREKTGFLVAATVDPSVMNAAHATSARDGGWRLPEYVLREPLHYDTFVRAVVELTAAEWSAGAIARALGICERDIAMAFEIHGAAR